MSIQNLTLISINSSSFILFYYVESTVLSSLNDREGKDRNFGEETFCEVVKGYFQKGNIKGLANLIIEVQTLVPSIIVDKSIGYAVAALLVHVLVLDYLTKHTHTYTHHILDEMNALGCSVDLGVYVPILHSKFVLVDGKFKLTPYQCTAYMSGFDIP